MRYLHAFTQLKVIQVVCTTGDLKGTLRVEYDDVSMKTELILSLFVMLSFNEKSIFNILMGFTPYWDYKPTTVFHAYSTGIYTTDKILTLNTIDKIHLKFDVIDSSIVSGLKQPKSFSFILDEPSGYKLFCKPEIIRYKKINRSVLNTMIFLFRSHY